METTSKVLAQGRLLSDELGPKLYNALRERVLKARQEAMKQQEEMFEPDDDTDSDPLTPCPLSKETIVQRMKELIKEIDYMKRVRRGMLLHFEYLQQVETENAEQSDAARDENSDAESVEAIPTKKRRRPKTSALSMRKGSRRAGQSARTGSRLYPIWERLRRRSSPAAKYSLRGPKFLNVSPSYTMPT